MSVPAAVMVLCAVNVSSATAMTLRAQTTRLGASEASVRLTAKAPAGSQCDATVRAHGQRPLRLPTLVTTHRRVAWRNGCAGGRPAGKVEFLRAVYSSRPRNKRRRVGQGARWRITEHAGFTFPGSLSIVSGRYLHLPKPQTIDIDPTGSKGAGGDGNPANLATARGEPGTVINGWAHPSTAHRVNTTQSGGPTTRPATGCRRERLRSSGRCS
jgi:hypothetical protein